MKTFLIAAALTAALAGGAQAQSARISDTDYINLARCTGLAEGAGVDASDMEQALRDDVLVAHHMEGKPVSRKHGGPVRLYVAPMYGYKSLKWLERIEVTTALDEPTDPGYWENLGYEVDAWVGGSNGRSDAPT